MPAPQHYRLTYSGIFGTRALPVEEWSMGVSLGPAGGGPFKVRADLEADVGTFAARWANINAGITNNVHLTEVTLALVDETGHTPRDASGAYIQAKHQEPALAGISTARNPLQIAVVVSLHTTASGATGRGRFYMPSPLIGSIGEDGRMGTSTRDGHATRAQTFITNLNFDATAKGYGTVVVASAGSALQGIAPALRPVVFVSVGRVVDTQRRRRGDLEEERLLLAVA